ncbi:MAG: EpsG family protein [Thomasclavelia ramosa]
MNVYLGMFIIAEIFAFMSYYLKGNEVNRNVILFQNKKIRINQRGIWCVWLSLLSFLPFFLVASLRYNVGTDYIVYSRLQIPQVMDGIYKKVEFLYRYVIKIGMSFGDKQWVFVITHFIILLFLFLHVKRYSKDFRWSIFVFMFGAFFNVSLNIMRQFIAISIFVYATKYICKREFWKYEFWIMIAVLFHKTALIYIPIYFLPRLKIKKWIYPCIVLFCAVFSKTIRRGIIWLTSVFGVYESYFNSQFDTNNLQWDFFAFNTIVLLIIFYVEYSNENYSWSKVRQNLTLRESESEEKNYEYFIFQMQIATTLVSVLSAIIPNSTRIIFMFSIFQITYIPIIIRKISKKYDYILVTISFWVLYIITFYRLVVVRNIGETLIYQSIFSK